MKNPSNELRHHGVIGMKWGIRRYRNKDGTLTPEGKKRYSQQSDYTIKKGSKLYRLTTNKDEPIDSFRKYLSTNKKGNREWQKYFKDTAPYFNFYTKTYEAIKDIKVASYSQVGKIYADSVMTDKKFAKQTISDFKEYTFGTDSPFTEKEAKSLVSDFIATYGKQKAISWESYNEMLTLDDYESVFNFLKKAADKGYDAITDVHGVDTVSGEAIINLKPKETIKEKKKR